MAQSTRVRPPIPKLTTGRGRQAGVLESNNLMDAVDSLGQSFTKNRQEITNYTRAVDKGLANIDKLVNEIAGLIDALTAYIEQLRDQQTTAVNNAELKDIITELEAQKQELIAVINYTGQTIQQNNLNEDNASLTTSSNAAGALMTQIINTLRTAIEKANTIFGASVRASAEPPSNGTNPVYSTSQANSIQFASPKLTAYVKKVIGDLVKIQNPDDRYDYFNEALKNIDDATSISPTDKDRASQIITDKYRNQKGGKRPHRRTRTKKSRTHKKSKKSRKINYKGGYLARSRSRSNGRGRRSLSNKHTQHR